MGSDTSRLYTHGRESAVVPPAAAADKGPESAAVPPAAAADKGAALSKHQSAASSSWPHGIRQPMDKHVASNHSSWQHPLSPKAARRANLAAAAARAAAARAAAAKAAAAARAAAAKAAATDKQNSTVGVSKIAAPHQPVPGPSKKPAGAKSSTSTGSLPAAPVYCQPKDPAAQAQVVKGFAQGMLSYSPYTQGMLSYSPYTQGMLSYSPYTQGMLSYSPYTQGMLSYSPYTQGMLSFSPYTQGMLSYSPCTQAFAADNLRQLVARCDSDRRQIAAAPGIVSGLMELLSSSSKEEAAAAALRNLQQQVDLSNVEGPRLASLRACSGLTEDGFRRWLNLPVDTCIAVALPASVWWDRGCNESFNFDAGCIRGNKGDTLKAAFERKQAECKLKVEITLAACMELQGDQTLLGFKLQQIQADVQQPNDVSSSSNSSNAASSSSSGGRGSGGSSLTSIVQKGVVLGFMDRVWLSLEVQKLDGSSHEPLQTVNCNETDYVVERRTIQNDYHYKYKEHVFKSLEMGLVPKGTLGWEASFKQLPGSAGVVEVPLVSVKTQAQSQVPAEFGSQDSSPCTVEVTRQPRNTLLSNAVASLRNIKTNPGNKAIDVLCYQVALTPDCLSSSGHLLADKLIVKIAVGAVGGLLTTYNAGKVLHDAQEVEVHGNFATSLVDGRLVQLSPLLPPQKTPAWPGCKLHKPGAV
ncbi:hypothetical protein OEZ86_013729 [Tetradesmus obliquus]|nr:hypothetical protein OEZ86_013729 [Tetradesmus obliquus]